jgi:hypothetical protein
MMKSQWLGFLAILFSVTACAPVTYETTYRPQLGHVSVNNTHYQRGQTQAYLRPIQVTLYSDSTSTGFNFAPIHVVISDGEYVAIPVKNRRGRSSQIFAHYHQGNLHFDANRKCQKILGSSGYQYDRRWDKGYKYARVNAGHDYDFTGLRLVIRSNPQSNSRPKQVTSSKDLKVSNKTRITDRYKVVTHDNRRPDYTKIVTHKPSKNVKSKVVVTTNIPKGSKQPNRYKHLESEDKIKHNGSSKSQKIVRPDIVRELAKHNKTNRKAATASKRSNTHSLKVANKSAGKRSNVVKNQHIAYEPKSKRDELKRKSTSKPSKVNRGLQNASKGNRGSVSENRKEVQSAKKKVTRTPRLKQSKNKRGDQQEDPEGFALNLSKNKDKSAQGKTD